MITRDEAWALLCNIIREPFHLRHGEVVEGCRMRYFARELGYGEEEEFRALWAFSTTPILNSGRRSTATSAGS